MRRIDLKTGRPMSERYPDSEVYASQAAEPPDREMPTDWEMPTPAKWFLVFALGIIPGLIVLACVLSHRQWLRIVGWWLAFILLVGTLMSIGTLH